MPRVAIVSLALAVAVPAHANVGKRSFGGTRSTEPTGLRDVAIAHEQLQFDLRPLSVGEAAHVAVTYELDNRSAAPVTAPLVFVSGGRIARREIVVTFDQANVRGELSNETALPAAWSAPLATPALDGDGTLGYETDDNAIMAFTLAIPPGHHQLAVTYDATPQRNRSQSGGTIVYQLGYVLAPARDWGAFGTLDVAVDVPAGWRAAAAPALARTGDALRGQFHGLPADTIGITVQAPTGTLYAVLQIALPLLALAVLVGGGVVMFALGRRRRDKLQVWPVSLPASLAWAVAIAISGGYAAVRSDLALPAGQSAAYGYGGAFGILLAIVVGLVAIPAGMLLARAGSRP